MGPLFPLPPSVHHPPQPYELPRWQVFGQAKFEKNGTQLYRERLKGMQILLSGTLAGPGRTGKQEQEQTSRNHLQTF